jgi:hypothetical protein
VKRLFIILLLLSILSGVKAYSQESNSNLINQTRILAIRELDHTIDYNHVDGNPYYTLQFIKGTAYLKDGNYATLPYRYDLFRDEIEFVKEDKIYWLKKKDIKFVRYGSDMLIVTHALTDTSKLGYFFLKEAGKYRLLIKKRVDYYPEVQPKGYSATIPAYFKKGLDEIFIQPEGLPAQKIENNKELKTVFNGNQLALDYIRKENIRANKEADLLKLITFLNKELVTGK